MPPQIKYMPKNSRGFNRFVKATYGAWLFSAYRVETLGAELFQDLKPPYVIMANHVTTRDPFFLSITIPEPVYWVTSDGNLRTPLMRFLLSLVGSIPKSKAIPDIDTVNWIVEVIKNRKGAVGIFPEGQQSWDGHTLPLFPSSAKLLRLLKVPVVVARLEGAYFSLPRWSWKRRPGKVRVRWSLLFDAQEIKTLGAKEIAARLDAALAYDEYERQALEPLAFESPTRAERVELGLFTCQDCGAMGEMQSSGSRLTCTACGSAWDLDAYGYFHKADGTSPRLGTIRAWDLWQAEAFAQALAEARQGATPGQAFLQDRGAILLRGRKMAALKKINAGSLHLFPDRLELRTLRKETLVFPLDTLDGIGVLKRNLLEFYQGRDLYQIRFTSSSVSSRKWAMALEGLKGDAT